MKYILKNITLLNILLIIVIIMGINYIALPFFNVDIKYIPPHVKEITNKDSGIPEKKPPSFTEYMIIAEQNPFHPERIIPVEKVEKKEEKKEEKKPLPKPEIVLYGTVISDDISLAYIEDKKNPVTTPGRGKRVSVIKKGQEVGGFILKEIQSDKIVLEREKEKMIVNLISPSKKREVLPPPNPSK